MTWGGQQAFGSRMPSLVTNVFLI